MCVRGCETHLSVSKDDSTERSPFATRTVTSPLQCASEPSIQDRSPRKSLHRRESMCPRPQCVARWMECPIQWEEDLAGRRHRSHENSRSLRLKTNKERRAKPARRTSRLIYSKTVARESHPSRWPQKNQCPRNRWLSCLKPVDRGFGAVCPGACPFAAVFESASGSATSPKHRTHTNTHFPAALAKPETST